MKKIRLKEVFFETEEFPRYHSNCRTIHIVCHFTAPTSHSPLRGVTREPTVVSAPGSEGMGQMEFRLSALSSYRLSGKLCSDRLRHRFYLVLFIIALLLRLVKRILQGLPFVYNFRQSLTTATIPEFFGSVTSNPPSTGLQEPPETSMKRSNFPFERLIFALLSSGV